MHSTEATLTAPPARVETFRVPAARWWQAIAYCLLMSLVGLHVYPMLLPLGAFLMWRWRSNRYDFTIELMLLIGGFGLMAYDVLPVKIADFGLLLGIVGFLIYRKNGYVKRVTLAMLAYFAVLFLLASTSIESMSVQFIRLRSYLLIGLFFVPLLTFANRRFEWPKFIESLVLHALVICGFYVIDTFIIGGFILLPAVMFGGGSSTIYDPHISGFLAMPRHYPPGLYWLIPCIVALNYKQLRLSWVQWAIVLLAIYTSRTNSLLFALLVCWVCFRPGLRQVALYGVAGLVLLVVGYNVDKSTGGHLRLAENIDQFTSLEAAQDDEDLAEFGTGRMAQILPKWELLEDMGRLHLGFGFIHPEKSTNPIFQIRNNYYSDVSVADEVVTEVEVTQVQTILDCGFIGLFAQLLFFVGVYFIIRKLDHSLDYLNVIVGASVLGVAGFAGFNGLHGLTLISTVLGAVLAANKTLPAAAGPDPEPLTV